MKSKKTKSIKRAEKGGKILRKERHTKKVKAKENKWIVWVEVWELQTQVEAETKDQQEEGIVQIFI